MFVILARFSPISKAEISSLHVSVSILVGFEEANNYLDWEVGHQISNIYCKSILTLYIKIQNHHQTTSYKSPDSTSPFTSALDLF